MRSTILATIIFGVLCCSPAYAIRITYHYDTSALSFVEEPVNSIVYEKLIWLNSSDDINNVGYPELPVFHYCERISDNTIVDSVKVTLPQGVSGVLSHPIRPIQSPILISDVPVNKSWAFNDSIYNTNGICPHNNLVNYHVDQSRDGRFLSLAITPFRYNPVTNEYTAYSVAEVDVFTHEAEPHRDINHNRLDIGIPYYEYAIITSSQLAPAFEPFARWKRAKGYNVGIIDINDILNNAYLANGDELSNISDDAGKLRQYLIYAYNTAQTKYVLLGGSSAIIPIRYAKTNATDSIPNDFYYSELNCNWDANNNGRFGDNNDHVDFGAELYVGRLLCDSISEVINWTKKVLQYEINPGNGDYSYLGRALFSQADEMQNSHQAESIRQKLQGHIKCTILNEYPGFDAPEPIAPLGAEIIDSINTIHYGLLGNFNHGGAKSYSVTAKYTNGYGENYKHVICAMDEYDNDAYSAIPEVGNGFDNLTNGIYPSIMYSISCTNIPFDNYNSPNGTYNLGRVFTCRSKGGGPAYLGNTREGYIPTSTNLYKYFLDSILANNHVNHLGIAEAKSKLRQCNNYLRHCHNLLGCPEMSLYTQVPNTFDNVSVNVADSNMVVSTGTDSIESRICLSGEINGIFRQFVYANRSHVRFDTIPDAYTLVISMPNYIPYIQTNSLCFLQNITISDNQTYGGCSTFYIGSDISSLKPYGNVIIENGADVTITVGDEVIIKNDFEVKLGGKLEIR